MFEVGMSEYNTRYHYKVNTGLISKYQFFICTFVPISKPLFCLGTSGCACCLYLLGVPFKKKKYIGIGIGTLYQ